jgi:hypothetical protein
MAEEYDIRAMAAKIRALRRNAEALKEISGGIPTVDRNADRILADVRMLEISVNDALAVLGK